MGNNKEVTEYNNLAARYPDIAAQWDWDKNGALRPEKFLPGSGKKVWWKCACGHEWNTAIYHRTEGHGCKICAGRKAVLKPSINDLATKDPELAAQWDDEKNYPLTASDVTAYSQAKVWWRCEKGHSWENRVSHRYQGEGCPYCSGNRILSGFNDIVTLNSPFLKDWDYEKNTDIRPDEVGPGTVRKVWWKCGEGHEWQAPVYSRNAGNGCPYCAGQKVIKGINDLASQVPWLAADWDDEKNYPLKPDEVMAGSSKKVWWKCSRGHSWQAVIASRNGGGRGCPYCAGHLLIKGENDLLSQRPDIAAEWDYDRNGSLGPDSVTVMNSRKVWWKCSKEHSYFASVADRSCGTGCPYCAGVKVLKGFNDLETVSPEIAEDWDNDRNGRLGPSMVTDMSNRKVWWKCEKGHEWQAAVSARHRGGCPFCSNRRLLVGFNDLSSVRPDIASEWDREKNGDITPESVVCGSHLKAWWKCSKGHEWQAVIGHRSAGTGCPVCARMKNRHTIDKGRNDLATLSPWLLDEWDFERNEELRPEDFREFSTRKVWWVCASGHHWRARIQSRQRGTGCPYCAGKYPVRSRLV